MNKYEIIVYWSEPGGMYSAGVPELPGCIAGGHTYVEAVLRVARLQPSL